MPDLAHVVNGLSDLWSARYEWDGWSFKYSARPGGISSTAQGPNEISPVNVSTPDSSASLKTTEKSPSP